MAERNALFISHASPEDNDFTLWLGAKLSAMGYEVWADVLRLRGGEDWQRKLEDALRHKAQKVLLVANEQSVQKQGVRNEIQIATDISRKIGDTQFIIPLRTSDFDAPFLIAHAQYIDFKRSWSNGLAELLEVLDESAVPKIDQGQSGLALEDWRQAHLHKSRSIVREPETLISNWLKISTLPEYIRIFNFRAGIVIGAKDRALRGSSLPLVPHGRGFIGLSSQEEYERMLGENFPVKLMGKRELSEFMEFGWSSQGIMRSDAGRIINDLLRQGMERHLNSKGINALGMANGQLAWWWPKSEEHDGQISFAWNDGPKGRRQIVGDIDNGNIHWHYGLSFTVHANPIPHIALKSRVIFTQDGKEPIGKSDYMFQLRRSKTKSWRNPRWRDMMLAFLNHLLEGKGQFEIEFGHDAIMTVSIPPIMFEAPVTVYEADIIEDEISFGDDVEIEEWDEDDDEFLTDEEEI